MIAAIFSTKKKISYYNKPMITKRVDQTFFIT
jgi:hypothetical protein